jgi:hypothetical protein
LITFIINRNRPLLSEQEKNISELKKQNGDLLRNQQDLESELDRMGELLEQTLRTTLMNKETALMNWRDLNEQVRATFPFLAFDTPERLNLVELAKQYLWVFNSPARRTIFIQTRTLDRAVLASESDLVQHSSASPTQSAALKSSSAAKHIGGKTHIYLRSPR